VSKSPEETLDETWDRLQQTVVNLRADRDMLKDENKVLGRAVINLDAERDANAREIQRLRAALARIVTIQDDGALADSLNDTTECFNQIESIAREALKGE
jgi:hypothetical protein